MAVSRGIRYTGRYELLNSIRISFLTPCAPRLWPWYARGCIPKIEGSLRILSSLLVRLDFGLGMLVGPFQKFTESHPTEARVFHLFIKCRKTGQAEMPRHIC